MIKKAWTDDKLVSIPLFIVTVAGKKTLFAEKNYCLNLSYVHNNIQMLLALQYSEIADTVTSILIVLWNL